MRMSDATYNNLNTLTALCFDGNAIVDNLAYSLDYHYFNKIADVVHHSVAHIFPEWADEITNEMLILSARPVRKDIGGYEDDYESLRDIFDVLYATLNNICNFIKRTIDDAEFNDDAEVRIFGEDLLMKINPYLKQAEEWKNAAEHMDAHTLNIHILDYTHFIEIK